MHLGSKDKFHRDSFTANIRPEATSLGTHIGKRRCRSESLPAGKNHMFALPEQLFHSTQITVYLWFLA